MIKSTYKGLTLSELMVATMISLFAFTVLLALFINCIFLNEANRNLTTALTHAQYILEDIKSQATFSQTKDRLNSGYWNLTSSQLNSTPYNFPVLPNESVATNVINATDPLVFSIRVNWKDRGLRARSTELRTLITDTQ